MNKLLLILSVILLAYGCKKKPEKEQEIIGQWIPEIENGIMTPESMWAFGRLSEFHVSPDKSQILYVVTFFDIQQNKGNRELFLLDFKTKENKQITKTASNESNPRWTHNGTKISFIYPDENGNAQIFEMNPDGSNRQKISNIENGIISFEYSPTYQHILFTANVVKKPTTSDLHPDMPNADVRIIDNLMYRHWDHWVESFSQIFVAGFQNGTMQSAINIMEGEQWESPLRPLGGIEQITWTKDGKNIVYTSRKKVGLEYAISTNSDLYMYNLENKTTVNLTDGMLGYDKNPVFSNNGKFLAWESMERGGYEADKHRLMVMNLETKEKSYITENFDGMAYNITWSNDDNEIFFISDHFGKREIFRVNLTDKNPIKVTDGIHDFVDIAVLDNLLIASKQSMSKPSELYSVDLSTGAYTELSFINKELLSKIRMGKVEKRNIKTTDNKDMLTWIIYPPDFDPTKKYPTLLYCQGGPQSMVSQFWSYRWNFQMMAAKGYIVVAPNRRGLPGFGMEWLEQISGDYGGQNIKDYLSAIDEFSKESFVDKDNLGAIGASYGGFSVFHLAGMHKGRFSAFISHAGIFNFDAQYLETEELWFPNWDFGGPFWKKDNPIVKRSYAASPHLTVQNWDTPILIIHGKKDYRISYTQSMQAFNAAQILGVPSKLVLFPEENHWILKPQNGIVWQREFFSWLDKYLKD